MRIMRKSTGYINYNIHVYHMHVGFFSVVVTTVMSKSVTTVPFVVVVQAIPMSAEDVNVSMRYLSNFPL